MQLRSVVALASLSLSACALDDVAGDEVIARGARATTVFTKGAPKPDSPFFAALGTNDRSCASCHVQAEGWSVTPDGLEARFAATDGLDPVFRRNDGSVSPTADVSTLAARRAAYGPLLRRGVFRVGMGIPAGAEFTLAAVDDPYRFASERELSLFRRPLPSTNLRFLSAVMWDGREASLAQQSVDATMGHAEATGTKPKDMDGIVKFETSIYTAQAECDVVGELTQNHGDGGPEILGGESFFIGINDPIGMNPRGETFDPRAFTLFDEWVKDLGKSKPNEAARAALYRGQELFNRRTFAITGVGGLNDALGAPSIQGTCTTCHDTPNVGNHSVAMALNLGISDASRRTADMPLYTLRNTATGATVQTTDPGRALITGKWADIGKFKGPILRAVALRAPYFHNGIAPTLGSVVDLYNTRFSIGLTPSEQADIVAFLQGL
ncbi:hypothetical protein BH11MYX3_BH11MYX3_33190 [soil metagenome]